VRVRHVIQVERVGRGDAGNDADFLNPQQGEDRPEHINELHGDEKQPQRDTFLCSFGGKANAVVTYKQKMLLFAFPGMPLGIPLRHLCRIHNCPRHSAPANFGHAIMRGHSKHKEPSIA
jgi:hypothetical protein